MSTCLHSWEKFVKFYHDANNARKLEDEEFFKDEYIGEELDWKMLADHLSLLEYEDRELIQDGFEEVPIDSSICQSP